MSEYFVLGGRRFVLEKKPLLANYIVKPDWETERWGYKSRSVGVTNPPAVFPISPSPDTWPDTTYCNFTAPWQWFWVDLLSMSRYGKIFDTLDKEQRGFIIRAFNGTTSNEAFAHDFHGTDKYRNYITKERLSSPLPKQQSVICAMDEVFGMEIVTNSKGVKMIHLLSFNVSETPPEVTPEIFKDPRVIRATTIRPGKVVGNFSHLRNGSPVYYPFLTKGDAWYPLHELKKKA